VVRLAREGTTILISIYPNSTEEISTEVSSSYF